jgi:citrate synthase
MSILKDKLAKKVPEIRDYFKNLVKEKGETKLSEVSVATLYGGLRGVKGLICDTSSVPADKGLLVRGKPIGELVDRLPEEILYLLLAGELPNKAELEDLQKDLKARGKVPSYVWDVLKAMPKESHPMAMFNTAVLVMENESKFRQRYDQGMKKDDYWDAAFEDAMDLIAKLPEVGAWIYRTRFNKGAPIPSDPNLDWGANYAKMTGLPDPNGELTKLMRLYFVLHCDHEGGNVSAFSAHTIGSALSDLYYALAGGLNGLAGPLHGLANQECLGWILETNKKFNGSPSKDQLEKFAQDTLNAGRVVPGYGHAVLRITDPRFTAFYEFGKKYCPSDPAYKTMALVFEVVPEVLKKVQKIKDPWPNVDAASGSLLYHYGMTEFPYYTVLFSISRALGISSQYVINRAMGSPIVRPKSMTSGEIQAAIEKAGK